MTLIATIAVPEPANRFDDELWRRLAAMQLDNPAAALTFTARLARENGWTLTYAQRVVAEYRRFLYLAARAGHPVTPSEEIDQAWHLHLLYTRHYWGVLCKDILGFDLHHGPTLGGEAEGAKFAGWYSRTLESYAAIFGAPPPDDVWPAPARRFDPRNRCVRVNPSENWIVPRFRWRQLAAGSWFALMFPAIIGLTGASPDRRGDPEAPLLLPILLLIGGIFAFVGGQTQTAIGAALITGMLVAAAFILPRGVEFFAPAGIVRVCIALAIAFAACRLFIYLVQTRDQRGKRGSGCGGGCGSDGGAAGGSGCGSGCGGGCGGCGG